MLLQGLVEEERFFYSLIFYYDESSSVILLPKYLKICFLKGYVQRMQQYINMCCSHTLFLRNNRLLFLHIEEAFLPLLKFVSIYTPLLNDCSVILRLALRTATGKVQCRGGNFANVAFCYAVALCILHDAYLLSWMDNVSLAHVSVQSSRKPSRRFGQKKLSMGTHHVRVGEGSLTIFYGEKLVRTLKFWSGDGFYTHQVTNL